MASYTTTLNVNVDAKTKEEATRILKELGLNMTTAVNMFLAQIVRRDGIPFEVVNNKPSREVIKALKEADKIEKEIKANKRKGYRNTKEMLDSILNDWFIRRYKISNRLYDQI